MSQTNGDLDLSQVQSDDYDQLAMKVETYYKGDSAVKSQLAWNWERNHLMLDGKQWITYESNQATGGMWKPLKVSKQNEYIPRPVTNYMYDIYQTLKSYLIKNKPRSKVYPNTSEYNDRQAAELATLCLECNWVRLREQQNYEYAASCLITYGTVFKKDFWDTTTINMVRVPRMKVMPATDPNTGMPTGAEEQVPEVDPETGDQLYDEMPIGDVNTEVVEPYRIALDPLATDLHKARWIMEYSIQPLAWIVDTYGKQDPGYTGLADQVTAEENLSNSLKRFYNLKTSSGVRSGGSSAESSTGTDSMLKNAAVVKEYYERPSTEFPKGRLIVVANGKCLYSGESPCTGPEQGDWHPYSDCRWELVPGRFWGKSPFDDAVEIQKQINSIDAIIMLVRKTMAAPQKLIPMGMGITPGMWTGRPAQEVFYKDNGTGAKPETIPGIGIDASVFQEREQRVSDMKEITGAIDILKGDRPPGVNAASALSLLYEVGTGKLFPVLDRWKYMVEISQKKQLRLIHERYKEPREDYVRMLRAKNTELSDEAVSKFIGTDLQDNCNVVVEAGSNVPKLQAAHQARLMELAQTGTLNLQLPANRIQFLQDMGVIGYDNDIGPDMKRAKWENSRLDNIKNDPGNMPVVLDCDQHDVHIAAHENRQKEPSFMSQPAEVQQAYAKHIMEHQQFQQQQQQAAILQAQATGAPLAPPSSGTAPTALKPAGKGATKEMKNATMGADVVGPPSLGSK